MKNALIFISGMATMFAIILALGIIARTSADNGYPGLTIFEKDAQCISAKQLQVFQVLEPDMALAHAKNIPNSIYDPNEILVLLLGDETTNYYDDQKINVPKGKCAKQVGTFKYSAKIGEKTVPAVVIE